MMAEMKKQLEQELEKVKFEEYECPGPTREVAEETSDRLEDAIDVNPLMNWLRCIELDCCECDVFDVHEERIEEIEERLDDFEQSEQEKKEA